MAELASPKTVKNGPKLTTNSALQEHLQKWVELVDIAVGHPNPSVARTDVIMTFCRSFVPADVTEDDVTHFSGNLASDDEYFLSMQRELKQCASGEGVESISGNQKTKAVFILQAPEGAGEII